MALFKCVTMGADFEVSYAQDTAKCLSPARCRTVKVLQNVGLSATSPAPCLPARHHAPRHDNNGLNL